jgi:antitoxin ParD1/3/4
MPSSYAVGVHFERFIKEQVQGGRYASASEVVRDALRLLEEQERLRLATLDALRSDIRKGLESGPGKPADEVLERLERKYAAMTRERRAR